MRFQFHDHHIEEFQRQGSTVFRGIVPPSLVEDLRRVTDRAREIARERQGAQTQRLQPLLSFDLDPGPIRDYLQLAELRDAVQRVLSPNHSHGTEYGLGVLLEPGEQPYCTPWHRDVRDHMAWLPAEEWDRVLVDPDLMNQVNCALYEDSSLWVVPGSHCRRDLPEEQAAFPQRPPAPPGLEGKTSAERERICLRYCEQMPGAQRLLLDAGDYALYRSGQWHLGNYIPYRKRATLHDFVETERFRQWRDWLREESAAPRRSQPPVPGITV